MPDDAQPAAPSAPLALEDFAEVTRRRLMYALVVGFFGYAAAIAYLLLGKAGYEMSAPEQAIVVMTLTAIVSWVNLALGYYYGTTTQATKNGKTP